MSKRCIWCLKGENEVTFDKKAHTIPKSLGGQRYNKFVCDLCNEYFGATSKKYNYSIEEALKETFCLSRQRFLIKEKTKRQIGVFKSKFFDIKERNGKVRLIIKPSFRFNAEFQKELCRNFKKGLLKMWFEEFDRQTKHINSYDEKYQSIRNFARFDIGDFPIYYFERSVGMFVLTEREAETPFLMFGRMNYLLENEKFTEIEFLGHVFGFPITEHSRDEFENYLRKSGEMKKDFFSRVIKIEKLTDIDFALSIIDK